MKIFTHKPKGIDAHREQPYTMLRVTTTEALGLIKSLAGQLKSNNPNLDRPENYIPGYGYFSICVSDERGDFETAIARGKEGIKGLEFLEQISKVKKVRNAAKTALGKVKP